MSKKHYEKPILEVCGSVNERTLGQGGSYWDPGHDSYDKVGSGGPTGP